MNKLENKEIGVAISGGVDSVALVKYLMKKKFNVTLFFFDHKNDYSQTEFEWVLKFTCENSLKLIVGNNTEPAEIGVSKEDYWRRCRYKFLNSQEMTIATAHTLDDVVEWYLFTCCHGEGHVMPYQTGNIIRPFLLTRKDKIIKYCLDRDIRWLEDKSNEDFEFAARNRIRHKIIPEILKINPGIHKVLKKKLMTKWRI